MFRHTSDDHPSVAVPDESHVLKVFEVQNPDDIVNMGLQADGGGQEVGIIFQAAQTRNRDRVTCGLQDWSYEVPGGGCLPSAMH
jgi:hypothetical protein